MIDAIKYLIGSRKRDIYLFARKVALNPGFAFSDVDGEYISCDGIYTREEIQNEREGITSYQQKMFDTFLKSPDKKECYLIKLDWRQLPNEIFRKLNEYRLVSRVPKEYAERIRLELINWFEHASVYKYCLGGSIEKISDNYYEWHAKRRGVV